MYEGNGAERRSGGAYPAERAGLPGTGRGSPAATAWIVSCREAAAGPRADRDPAELMARLAEVPAGAGLASLVEGLLAGVLVPTGPIGEAVGSAADEAAAEASTVAAADAADTVSAEELAELLEIPDTGTLFSTITSPADRTLARASAQLGVDWGEGTGIDRLASLGGQVLSELVAACHRLVSWGSWCEGAAAACLARTPEMNRGAAPWGPGGRPECLVTDEERRFTTGGEIACRLGTTRQGACQILDRGEALLQPEFAATEALHRAGLLDAAKTALLVRRLDGVSAGVAKAVQERVLPRASRRTTSQLAKDIDRLLAALDPDGASDRRKRNVARRHVTRPRQAGEGVHEMRLLLPSLDAFLLDATLDAIAASARAAGDERSPAQLRADAVTGMTLRALQGSQYTACRPPFTAPEHAGASGGPPAPTSTQLLPDGVPLEGLLAGLSSLVEPAHRWWTPSGATAVFPPPGITVNIDVTVPLEHLLPDGADMTGGPPITTSPTARSAAPATAEVTIGGADIPVPAITARSLAAGGVWRRMVTDPVSGTVLDVGRTHYRPPAALRELVQARDNSCTFPGCAIPASRCDTDHIQAWADGGVTTLSNLTSLCQAHHRLKHTPGWSLTRTDSGDLTWCTPTGARYQRSTDGSITLLAHKIGPRQLSVPAQKVPEHLAAAVDAAVMDRLQHGLDLSAQDTNRCDGPPRVTSRGPQPGQPVGAFEATAYPEALHDLGLTVLLDEIPPF
ncbi:HNH endonuclease [Actinomyces ruminicola]|uniref:HNH endonuclease n=1 Tax=Actinomyces ruminicola TaxID=332524 RepID=A0A1H0F1M2_9ACTO|nr:HNH endonuclease signature motif containing protein [Actinomyces ruminicola]SDN88446.1 HNH endonuclease [Actinomyces ruminicola]